MEQASVIAFWFATALYAAATVLYAYYFLDRRRSLSWYATFTTGAGFLMQTASIGLRSVSTDGTVLTGPNSLVLAAWALVLVYFLVEHVVRIKVYGAVLVPISAVLLMLAQLLGVNSAASASLTAVQETQLESWRVGIHVALIMFANAGFVVGAAASMLYLVQERQLKAHRTSVLFKRLPSLAQTDDLARRSIVLAYPAYTAGLVLGTIRAVETDVEAWYLDPRVMLAGIVWAVFGVYLYLRYRSGASSKQVAFLAMAGFVLVVVLAVIARTLPRGFHVFGA